MRDPDPSNTGRSSHASIPRQPVPHPDPIEEALMPMSLKLTFLPIALLLCCVACSTSETREGAGETATEGVGERTPGAGETAAAETARSDSRERTRRLLYLERAYETYGAADREQQYARRDSMAALIQTYAQDHLQEMIDDLRNGSPRQRAVMAGTLGFSARQEAVQPLIEALRDQYFEVVARSLFSLYRLARARTPNGDPVPIAIDPRPILPFLDHPRREVRSNAALALSAILNEKSEREFLVPLIAASKDEDPATRVHAMAAIGAMRQREGIPYLLRGLDDSVPLVRVRAALALARVGDLDAVPNLIAVLERKDEEEDVKKAAARALSVLLQQRMTLDPEEWRAHAATAGLPGF